MTEASGIMERVDGRETGDLRRWRLRLPLLLGLVGLCALVAAKLSLRNVDRAPVPERSSDDGNTGAPVLVAPESGGKATVDTEAPDWPLIARTRGAGRAYTASELTAALAAELSRDPEDLRLHGFHNANISALRDLLREKSETEILNAAAALLECRTPYAANMARTLVADVFGNSSRVIADDEAYAIVGEPAARVLETPASDVAVKMQAGEILASIGTPAATVALLRLLERGDTCADPLAQVSNPASVPLLSQALCSLKGYDASTVAAALGRSVDGRAELRRLLDPAGGFGWPEYADAKVAALKALAMGFRRAEDLSAIETALKQKPDLADAALGALARGRDVTISESQDTVDLTRLREQVVAIVLFLPGHEGAKIEDALFTTLARFQGRVVTPLLPRLEAARPGSRERVEKER